MKAFLRAEGDSVGFMLGLSLIVAGVALLSVPGAFLTAGFGLCFVFFGRIRAGKGS